MIDDTVTFSLQTHMPAELLLIDDEPFNLEILSDYLSDAGYKSKCYENPVDAWRHLDTNPNYKCILLDRMMPDMDGLDLLKKIKQDPRFEHVPVIMQTADGSHDSLCEGMRSGAFYYLTKPFSKDLLLTVVEAALADYNRYVLLQDHLKKSSEAFKLMNEAVFSLKSLQQADVLAAMLAKCCHNPNRVVLGLSELLINAIEHGNLGIDFDKKTELLSNGNWQEYINKKLISHPYSQRKVIVSMKKVESEFENKIEFIIKDEGDGFNWQALEDRASERLMQSHGRGILIAKNMSFDELNFIGSGNQVRACVKYPKNNQDIRENDEHIHSREKSRSC
jgi:CheY-like chemotaxis protein/anti-sigma regulatory factor (Ser/Thr protein kinase)